MVNMPLVQDHKRLLDGDQGPNTGGMGVVAPVLHFGAAIWEQIEEICKRTIEALRENGICYKGCSLKLFTDSSYYQLIV